VRLLLDSHSYYWWRASPERLSRPAYRAIENATNTVFISAATVWELAIKAHTSGWGEARVLLLDIEEWMSQQRFLPLPILFQHAREAGGLPLVHRDPFDRMLVAQARTENLRLVSNEALFDAYGASRLW
jgi:PIN domain nuclease of toxin-antitoxin system